VLPHCAACHQVNFAKVRHLINAGVGKVKKLKGIIDNLWPFAGKGQGYICHQTTGKGGFFKHK
jgi:hypothetical protein